ncbi:MAG: antibiotic biosynthesis monooxygenase [Chloroflexi bacterium]|nr:antibiotic biosynthesis monooxygenase [Chloroflexota bacterium]
MPYMFVRITLNSFDQWKAAWDSPEQAQIRRAYGCISAKVYRGHESTNEVIILTQWQDMEDAREWGISNELRELMHHTGGAGRPDVVYLDDVT